MFDTSDVSYDWTQSKSGLEIVLTMTSEGRFNLMKTYLALKLLVEKIETEIAVMDAPTEEQ